MMEDDQATLEEMAQSVDIGIVHTNENDFSPFIPNTNVANKALTSLDATRLDFEDIKKPKAVVRIPWNYITSSKNNRDHVIRQLPADASKVTIDGEVKERLAFLKELKSAAIPKVQKMIADSAFKQKMMIGSKVVQSHEDVQMAWKCWEPQDLKTLKAMFYSVEGQFLENPSWDEELERDFMENENDYVRYEYYNDPKKTKQHKKPKKCVATAFRNIQNDIKRSIIRAAETTHGFKFNITVPERKKPRKYWRRKAGDYSFHPLFLNHITDESKVEKWMKDYGKQMCDLTKHEKVPESNSPTATKQKRQIGYSKGTAGNAIKTDTSDESNDESEATDNIQHENVLQKGKKEEVQQKTNKDEIAVMKKIQALRTEMKQLKAKAKKHTKEHAQRMSVLQKENEKMRHLHTGLDCKKNEKHIKEGKKRVVQKKRKSDKGETSLTNNKKRKQETVLKGKDGNGMYQK